MPSPFPGMNPYLEHPEIWPGVHLLLIAAIAEFLTPQLRPKYAVSVEVRLYETSGDQALLVGIPDVSVQMTAQSTKSEVSLVAVAEPVAQPIRVAVPMPQTIRQGYLEIREVKSKEVVVVIELLSPVNKRPGKGRQTYESKRERVLGSMTHLVEIDLLRAWEPMPMYTDEFHSHYRILVSRGDCRPTADLYPFDLKDAIPAFPLPLRSGDQEPVLPLKELLDRVYDRAAYDLKIDYDSTPIPALAPTDAAWADAVLRRGDLKSNTIEI
jgi:Protein of unknown function (DUF4058)